jgi:hypothetical protein
MKTIRRLFLFSPLLLVILSLSACTVWNRAFAPKKGCPANGRSFGAERVLSGEKVPKTRKFRA